MSNRPKFAPPTVFVRMDGGGKPQREDGPSTPSNVKLLGNRGGGGRPQGRPGNGQGRPAPQQMSGGGRPQQQRQFAPQQFVQALQLSAPQLTLCRLLVHGYLKKGLDDIGEDNLKLAAVTLDMIDQMLGHAAATTPPPAPRPVQQPPQRTQRPQGAMPARLPADLEAVIEGTDNGDATAAEDDADDLIAGQNPRFQQRGGTSIAPRRVVRAQSSVVMPMGVVPAIAEVIDIPPSDVSDAGEFIDDQPGG